MKIYIGSYTKDLMNGVKTGSEGLYVGEFDDVTGRIRVIHTERTSVNPSFVAVSADNRLLIAVNEVLEDGALDSYVIGDNGTLIHLGRTCLDGSACCYVAIPEKKKFAVGVHYMDGELFTYPIGENGCFGEKLFSFRNNGSGPNTERQEGPHAHSSKLAEEIKTAVVCDLGCDLVTFYNYDEDGLLSSAVIPSIEVPKGCGPRHSEFTKCVNRLYISCELSNEVLFYERLDEKYVLKQRISTLPKEFRGINTAADIHFGKGNQCLYVSNRGHDSIAWYTIAESGRLSFQGCVDCGGRTPRNFAVMDKHIICANQESGNVTVLQIEEEGRPGKVIFEMKIPGASCIIPENR